MLTTKPNRLGQNLFPLEGFEPPRKYHHATLGEIDIIRQTQMIEGKVCERLFTIDTIESHVDFSQSTAISKDTSEWFERESATLTRYTSTLFA